MREEFHWLGEYVLDYRMSLLPDYEAILRRLLVYKNFAKS